MCAGIREREDHSLFQKRELKPPDVVLKRGYVGDTEKIQHNFRGKSRQNILTGLGEPHQGAAQCRNLSGSAFTYFGSHREGQYLVEALAVVSENTIDSTDPMASISEVRQVVAL